MSDVICNVDNVVEHIHNGDRSKTGARFVWSTLYHGPYFIIQLIVVSKLPN